MKQTSEELRQVLMAVVEGGAMKLKLTMVLLMFGVMRQAYAESQMIHREFTVGAESRLVIEVDPARLVVELGGSNRIVVDAEVPDVDLYAILYEQEDDKVTVKLDTKGTLGLLAQQLRLHDIDLRVQVPADCYVLLLSRSGQTEIRGVGGEIRSRSGSRVGRIIKWVLRIGYIVDSSQVARSNNGG
jgi:hypothetical protein